MRRAAAVGLALALAHAALLPALIAGTARPALELERQGGLVVEAGAPPPATVVGGARAEVVREGEGPGLVWTRWRVRYRGGVERAAGAVQLVGPFQDPAAPPCSGRLVIGQRLLDDGRAGPGTLAAVVAHELTAALADLEHFTIGRFRRVDGLRLRWAALGVFDRALFPAAARRAPAPTGYLRADAVLVFDRIRVPLTLGALIRLDRGVPAVTLGVRAHLDFDSRVLGWLNDKLGGDRLVSRLAAGQLDRSLVSALGPPPPLPLPGGRQLVVEPCGERPVQVEAGAWAAIPLRWKLGGPVGPAPIRPPARGPVAFTPPPADAPLTLDLDLDGLNGLLYELWRLGTLDDLLDRAALHDRFNRDPTVTTYLTLRASPLRLALPPTLAPDPAGLRLSLALAVDLADGATVTPATAFGTLAVTLGGAGDRVTAQVGLSSLDLTCEPRPGRLVPCYADLVAAIRQATPDSHALLAAALADTLTDLFAGQRLAHPDSPAALALDGVTARTDRATLRLLLRGHVLGSQ